MNSNLEKLIMGVQLLALGGILCACGGEKYNTDSLKEVGTPTEAVSEDVSGTEKSEESGNGESLEGGMPQESEADITTEGGAYQADEQNVPYETMDSSESQEGGMSQVNENSETQEGGMSQANENDEAQEGGNAYGGENGTAQEGGGGVAVDEAGIQSSVEQILDGTWEGGKETSVQSGSHGR